VPSPKRSPGRNPLQRLSDQRRSLALAGLAVGAVFGGVFLGRKRRGGGLEPEQALPPTPPVAQPRSEPPPAVAVPPAASEPEPPTQAPIEPATGELNAEEASILAVLAQDGRADEDRTVIAVATSLERESTDVSAVLRKLGAEGVVAGELYTALGDRIWTVTERGVRRLGAQH
jgi:hypothetical protein